MRGRQTIRESKIQRANSGLLEGLGMGEWAKWVMGIKGGTSSDEHLKKKTNAVYYSFLCSILLEEIKIACLGIN